MKWKKLGRIFNPTDHKLPNNCVEYSKSPQTLIFDDFVRIYFSAIEKDKTGKYLSHVAFVDMDKDFKKIINISTDTVLPLGELGTFDEHGIFPIHIFRDEDRILAYTTGWSRRESVSVETSVGLAESFDNGLTFKKPGPGPIFSSSLYEPFLVCDSFVKKYNGVYYMWYIYGTKWKKYSGNQAPDRVYKISCATSIDGLNWKRDGIQIIPDELNEDECQALPTVVYHKGRYHMYFCYREADGFRKNKDRAYRIGYAWSGDLTTWYRDNSVEGLNFSGDDWDSNMQCYPHIFHCDDKIYLLYNGNEFGRFGFGLAVLEE